LNSKRETRISWKVLDRKEESDNCRWEVEREWKELQKKRRNLNGRE